MSTGLTAVGKALFSFWSRFGIPAYPERFIPEKATLPYITYEVKKPDWRGQAPYTAQVWYKTTRLEDLTATVDLISEAIGEGIELPLDNGYLYLFKDDSFVQVRDGSEDPNDFIKVAYLTMIIHVFS